MMSYNLRDRSQSLSEDEFFVRLESSLDGKLDEKLKVFSNLKVEIIAELKAELKTQIKNEFQNLMKEQNKKLEHLESTVAMLQEHVKNLKASNEKNLEELEQYGRRLCVRVHGIPCKKDESADEVLNTIQTKINNAGLAIPADVVDRAHRIGPKYKSKVEDDEKTYQAVIIRFTTFRHRTVFYRNRKVLEGINVQLDLTSSRYKLLKDANSLVHASEKASYVYADINCRLKVKLDDGSHHYFDSLEALSSIIEENS